MKQFEIGKKYYAQSVCDCECVWIFQVIKRTKKTVTFQNTKHEKELITRNVVSKYNLDCESCLPFGRYSMAPSLSAEHEIQ